MATRIKDAMFSVFGENQLESINNSALPEEVMTWKNSEKTKSCYNKLFTPFDQDNPNITYMIKILAKVWPSAQASNAKSAFAITVCQTMLSSRHEKLTMKEKVLKKKIKKNLVS